MRLVGKWRSRVAVGLAVSAAVLQVMVVSSLPITSVALAVIAVPAALVAAVGLTFNSKKLTEIPIGVAMFLSGVIALLTLIPAVRDPWMIIIAFVEVDIFLLWVGAWALRQRDFDETATRWHRRYLNDDRWTSGAPDRRPGMGPRWEAAEEARREARDPFTDAAETRENPERGTD